MLKKLLILMGGVAFLTLLVFVINNSGPTNTADAYNEEQLIDALRVGVHYDVKNMGYQQYYDDELSGMEVDLSKHLAKYIYGDESLLELNSVSMKTAQYFLNNKKIDCIVATQPITDEKSDKYRYSRPYYTDYVECVYANGSIMSLSDLAGKKIGVINNSYAHKRLQALIKEAKLEASFVSYEGYSDGVEAVQLGKIDVFCTNRIFLPSSGLKRFTVGECKYCVVVRYNDTELLEKINSAIEGMENSGELKMLQDKYK